MGFLSKLFGGGRASPQKEHEMVSLVILLNEPTNFPIESVRAMLDATFPCKFLPVNDESFVVEGSNPFQFMIKSVIPSNSGVFTAHFVPSPYADFSTVSLNVRDELFLNRIKAH